MVSSVDQVNKVIQNSKTALDPENWIARGISYELEEIAYRLRSDFSNNDRRRLERLVKLLNMRNNRFYDTVKIFLDSGGLIVASMVILKLSGVHKPAVLRYLDLLVEAGLCKRNKLGKITEKTENISLMAKKTHVYYIDEKDLAARVEESIIPYFEEILEEKTELAITIKANSATIIEPAAYCPNCKRSVTVSAIGNLCSDCYAKEGKKIPYKLLEL